MASDDGSKRNVTSGVISFTDRLTDPILVELPVGESKAEEAQALIEDLFNVMRRHYLRSNRLTPQDVARCADAVARTWHNKSQRITEEKYNGDKRNRFSS